MSKIFQPYRALGLCSSDVPFIVRYAAHSKDYYALVPVGENFNVYKLPRLILVGISDNLNSPIRAFASSHSHVFAASGNTIYVFKNTRFLARELHGHHDPISHLIVFGHFFLASLDESGLLLVWNVNSFDIVFEMNFDVHSFRITCMLGPLSYQSKILLGSQQGALQLWNVRSKKQVYWFKGFGSAVTCLVQAPAIDVCAVGLSNGSVYLHNLRYDTTLLHLVQDGGAVTTICFMNGAHGLANPSNAAAGSDLLLLPDEKQDLFMITGNAAGQLSCWHLKENGESQPVGQTKQLHWDRLVGMFCVPGGDAAGSLVTTGADNCIKVSRFDRPDGGLRTIYKRSGHFRPPDRVSFWPGSSVGGSLVLSAGQDSMLRIWSTLNQYMDRSLGRAYAPGVPDRRKSSIEQRSAWLLPGVSQLSLCATRAEDWDSVVAIHTGRRQATTWNFVNATRGKHWLDPRKFTGKGGAAVRLYKHTVATAVCITNCGNYVLLGYSSGDVVVFNLQSGMEQGCYDTPTIHAGSVVGVAVNNVVRLTVTVGGHEVRFWSFHKRHLLDTVEIPADALLSRFHGDNDTLAVALSSGPILLFDISHRRIIRRFPNKDTEVCTDLVLSTDGRWLISAHRGDPLIKTWDIINGRLIDCFRVGTPVTSLALSPAGEFLATTHANCLGVYLWDNSGTYRRLHLQLLPDDYVPAADQKPVAMPTRSIMTLFRNEEEDDEKMATCDELLPDVDMENAVDSKKFEDIAQQSYISPEQLSDDLATLSGLPATYLTSFLHLDTVLERNRRATAVQSEGETPKPLPFFLPVIETEKGLAWVDKNDDDDAQQKTQTSGQQSAMTRKRNLNEDTLTAMESVPGLFRRLIEARTDAQFDEIMHVLKSLGPSALDLEIRLLAPSAAEERSAESATCLTSSLRDSRDRLHGFLRLLINRFQRKLDVDLACACLESVLQRHGDLLLSNRSSQPLTQNATEDSMDRAIHAVLSGEDQTKTFSVDDSTLQLVAQAVEAKSSSQSLLTRRLTRSICLVDFIRNPATVLHL